MKIGIIIVNYNGEKYTKECLDSLLKIEKKNFDVLTFVVDNNSSSPLKLRADDYKSINAEIIRSEKNLGFSGGNNLGIKEALSRNCDFILIINNDTIQKPDFLLKLLDSLSDSSIGIVTPKIYFSKGREYHKDRYEKSDQGRVIWYAGGILDMKNILASHRGVDEVDHGQFDKKSETDFATGCCMLVKKEVFEKIGMFDEKYFLYLEDLDLSIRTIKAGFKILYVPSSIIWHENAGSTGGSGSDLQDYFISRNRLLFGNKYASLKTKFALHRESMRILLKGRSMQKLGVKDYYMRNFGKGSMNL